MANYEEIKKFMTQPPRHGRGRSGAGVNKPDAPSVEPPTKQTKKHDISDFGEEKVPTVVLLTALYDEYEGICKSFNDCQWDEIASKHMIYQEALAPLSGRLVKIIAAYQTEPGMVAAAILATKMISEWKPELIAMTGICAGVKGKVQIGDIIVAKQVLDYGSGKWENNRFMSDYDPCSLDNYCNNLIAAFSHKKEILQQISNMWNTQAGKPSTQLQAHLGVIAWLSGNNGDEEKLIRES